MKKQIFTSVFVFYSLAILVAQNASKSGSCPGMTSFTDPRDGKTYQTVQIGDRCWMKENLNVGTYVTSGAGQLDNNAIEKFCFQNIEANCAVYGGLYQWNEMMEYITSPGIQGICPEGWLIPTDQEWCALASGLDATVNCNQIGMTGTNAGGQMKETGTTNWNVPNTGATNLSDFTALPGGYYTNTDNTFNNQGCTGIFHTSSSNGTGRWSWQMSSDDARVSRVSYVPGAFSVRCIRDANWTAQLSATPANQDVTSPAGSTTFEVTSNTNWAVTEDVSWLSISPSSGSNNGSFTVTYENNATGNARVGEITVTAEGDSPMVTVVVNQAPWICGEPVIDIRDGRSYSTVQIGTQCWMSQNINIGNRINGIIDQTDNGSIEKYCYNDQESHCDVYGGMYQWDEMMQYSTIPGVKGICPMDWHLPVEGEWLTLMNYLGGVDLAGGAMKETGTVHWVYPNTGATNSSGFTALPGGYRDPAAQFDNLGYRGIYCSSSQTDISNAGYVYLDYDYSYLATYSLPKLHAFSVRCLKD